MLDRLKDEWAEKQRLFAEKMKAAQAARITQPQSRHITDGVSGQGIFYTGWVRSLPGSEGEAEHEQLIPIPESRWHGRWDGEIDADGRMQGPSLMTAEQLYVSIFQEGIRRKYRPKRSFWQNFEVGAYTAVAGAGMPIFLWVLVNKLIEMGG